MNEEILRVLEMVKEGTISPEEGNKLISAITGDGQAEAPVAQPKKKYTMLRVRVDANDPKDSEKAKVTVNIPLSVAKKVSGLMNMVPNDAKAELSEQGIDLSSIDLAELIEMFERGDITEDLVNIEAGEGENKTYVKVYVD